MTNNIQIPILLFIYFKAVSRKCMHSFCYYCLTIWLKSSYGCPLCRNEFYLTVKNPLIDQFIDLIVDQSFTEEEKNDRSNLIQQRLISSSNATEEEVEQLRLLEHLAVLDPSVDTTLVARTICILKAFRVLGKIFSSDQFKQMKDGVDYDKAQLSIMHELLVTFEEDVKSFGAVLKTFPQSLKTRYSTFPLSS